MTEKTLLVSSAIQAKLMNEFLIDEIRNGFWINQRPATHGATWEGVTVVVSDSNEVGPINGFKPVRFYDFLNPSFTKLHEAKIVEIAQTVKPGITFKTLKKELIELARIIGGRMTDKTAEPARMYRGNNRDDFDVLRSVDRQRVKIAATAQRSTAPAQVDKVKPVKTAVRVEPAERVVSPAIRKMPASSIFSLGSSIAEDTEPQINSVHELSLKTTSDSISSLNAVIASDITAQANGE